MLILKPAAALGIHGTEDFVEEEAPFYLPCNLATFIFCTVNDQIQRTMLG